MWTSNVISLINLVALAEGYPVSYTNCGVDNVVDKAPQRVITMTQGATEFLLALGLENQMVGTAYLDDYIWPKYASQYAKIPVLSSAYPNETTIMSVSPDFMVSNFNSAFRQKYVTDKGKEKGIFSSATVGPCTGAGGEELGMSEQASNDITCRKELNSKGIGTYLFEDACEDKSLRPTEVSEAVVYSEMRTLGNIFQVNVEPLIAEMREDFDGARTMISRYSSTPLKAVWLDCVGRCCQVEPGEEPEVFVGAGAGAPAMLMQEAGLSNAFASAEGNWACVKEKDVIAAAPDVVIVVDAAWDPAVKKISWMYNHSEFCGMDAIKAARLVQIPFSATSLSPRNGPAALDLAKAALHVRMGTVVAEGKSGVGFFDLAFLETQTADLQCSLDMSSVAYADNGEAMKPVPAPTPAPMPVPTPAPTPANEEVDFTCSHHCIFVWLCLAVACMHAAHVR